MVKVIMGIKGAGKTKDMISWVNAAAADAKGVVVCLEQGQKLKFDISHNARLIDTIPYSIRSYQVLRGFITGLYAGNYDLHDVFIDSLYKVAGCSDIAECEKFLGWCDRFGKENGINFTISISDKLENATDAIKAYF